MKHRSISILSILTFIGFGCTVGPDYERPPSDAPAQFSSTDGVVHTADAPIVGWWKQFQDPKLVSLIDRGVQGNKEILGALARLGKSRALAGQALLELFPGASASTSYIKNKTAAVRFPGFSRQGFEFELYSIGLDALWEVDIFGGLQRLYEARSAEEEAAVADLQDVSRLMVAEIARTYFELRGYQAMLAVAQENVTNQEETVRLVETRSHLGAAPELDLARTRAQLTATRATIPPLQAAVRISMHRIAVLLGLPPAQLIPELEPRAPLPATPTTIALGSPEELLRRRPDVRKVERELASATALVGFAVSELFPKVTVNGALGVEARSPDEWTQGGGTVYNFGPSISWNILSLGRIRERILAADARSEQALRTYEKTILAVLEETENALTNLNYEQKRMQELREAVTESRRAFEMAQSQYQEGWIDLLSVLDLQRSLLQNERDLSQSEMTVATNLVGVYKTLGGGWGEITDETTAQKSEPSTN